MKLEVHVAEGSLKVFQTSWHVLEVPKISCIARPKTGFPKIRHPLTPDLTTNSWCYLCSHQVSYICVFHLGFKFTQDPTYGSVNKTLNIFVQVLLHLHRFCVFLEFCGCRIIAVFLFTLTLFQNYAVWKGKENIKPPEPQPSISDILKAKQLPISDEIFSPLAFPPLSPTGSWDLGDSPLQ